MIQDAYNRESESYEKKEDNQLINSQQLGLFQEWTVEVFNFLCY